MTQQQNSCTGSNDPLGEGTQSSLELAVAKWEQIVGAEFVTSRSVDLKSYATTLIPEQTDIIAVVKPKSDIEVQEVVKIAGHHNVPLYPTSTGRNWGYGTRSPVAEGNVVLDLSRMTRIEVNPELAYAIIEPGVTQVMLFRYLEENKIPLMLDVTGAGPQAGLLGNALERGYGMTPYGSHFDQICGMDVILSDGSLMRTGFGQNDCAQAAHVFRTGVGPYLDGLFTQSNLGIVTRMGLWLMPKPERIENCILILDNEEQFSAVIDIARSLLLQGTLKGAINFFDRNRVLTATHQYPWERMNNEFPLSEKVADELSKAHGISPWAAFTGLYGTKGEVRAAKRVLRKKLRGKVGEIIFISDSLLRLIERFPGLFSIIARRNLRPLVHQARGTFNILSGVPTEMTLRSVFWRSRRKVPERDIDPIEHGCGISWFAPVIPMTASHVKEFRSIVEPILKKHRFEACFVFVSVNSRAFDCTLPITYDKEDPDELCRASMCLSELLTVCGNRGYLPYRIGVQSMDWLTSKDTEYWKVVQKIKSAIDPDGIIAPGRYCPDKVT